MLSKSTHIIWASHRHSPPGQIRVIVKFERSYFWFSSALIAKIRSHLTNQWCLSLSLLLLLNLLLLVIRWNIILLLLLLPRDLKLLKVVADLSDLSEHIVKLTEERIALLHRVPIDLFLQLGLDYWLVGRSSLQSVLHFIFSDLGQKGVLLFHGLGFGQLDLLGCQNFDDQLG